MLANVIEAHVTGSFTVSQAAPGGTVTDVSVGQYTTHGQQYPITVATPVQGATGYKVVGGSISWVNWGVRGNDAIVPFSFDGDIYNFTVGANAPTLLVVWAIQACNEAGCGPISQVAFTTGPTPSGL